MLNIKNALLVALTLLGNMLISQNILIMDYNAGFSSDQGNFASNIHNYLQSTRPSVTRINVLPAAFNNALYDQVWVFGDPGANTAASLAPYLNYINAGGAVYFQSEVICCNNQAAFTESLIQQLVIGGTAYTITGWQAGAYDYQPNPGIGCVPMASFNGTGTALRPFNNIPNANILFPVTNTCGSAPYTVGQAAGVMFKSCDMISGNGALISTGDFNIFSQAASCVGGGLSSSATLDPNPVDYIADIFPFLLTCFSNTNKTINHSMCQGESYFFDAQNLTSAGTYYDTLVNPLGCDTIVTLNLSVQTFVLDTINTIICSGDSYFFDSQNLNTAGTYYDTIINLTGCDTAAVLNLSITPLDTNFTTETICNGSTYLFNGQNLNTPGIYYDTIINPSGCDTIIELTLSNQALTSQTINISLCSGGSYSFGGQNLTSSGTFYDTIKNIFGCDSIANELILNLSSSNPITLNEQICFGDNYTLGGQNLTSTGTYYDTIKNNLGCDSITTTLNLNVTPIINSSLNAQICDGNTYSFNGQDLINSGTYYDTVQNSNGCDSAITLTLSQTAIYNTQIDTSICTGDSIFIENVVFNSTGTYLFNYVTTDGCDSVININIAPNNNCSLYIYIPNSFTPNNDGFNDSFKPIIDGEIKHYEFYIFNQWGQIIHKSKDVEDEGWKGLFKNELVQSGIYIWELRYEENIVRKVKHGHVQVLK